MFKPVPFEPAGYRRSRAGLPRWLVLLLVGLAAGAGGVLYVQANHLPPRLSAADSERLRGTLERTEAEQQRLTAELAATKRQLAETIAQKEAAATEYSESSSTIKRLRRDIAALVAALPPDPHGGSVACRRRLRSRRSPRVRRPTPVRGRAGGSGRPPDRGRECGAGVGPVCPHPPGHGGGGRTPRAEVPHPVSARHALA